MTAWKDVGVALTEAMRNACRFGDPYCPCQDGDPCHYVDLPGSPAMTAPRSVP